LSAIGSSKHFIKYTSWINQPSIMSLNESYNSFWGTALFVSFFVTEGLSGRQWLANSTHDRRVVGSNLVLS